MSILKLIIFLESQLNIGSSEMAYLNLSNMGLRSLVGRKQNEPKVIDNLLSPGMLKVTLRSLRHAELPMVFL